MDLLRMVINEQKNVRDFPEATTIKPITKNKGPKQGAWVRMENVLHRNERITQRRETLTQAVAAFELRIEVILDEVQRLKTKDKVRNYRLLSNRLR